MAEGGERACNSQPLAIVQFVQADNGKFTGPGRIFLSLFPQKFEERQLQLIQRHVFVVLGQLITDCLQVGVANELSFEHNVRRELSASSTYIL